MSSSRPSTNSRPAWSRWPRSPVLIRPSTTVLLEPSEYPPNTSPPPAKIRPVSPVGTGRSWSSRIRIELPRHGRPTVPGAAIRSADVAIVAIPTSLDPYASHNTGPNRSMNRSASGAPSADAPEITTRSDRRSYVAISVGPRSSIRRSITGTATIVPARVRVGIREHRSRVEPRPQHERRAEEQREHRREQAESVEQRRADDDRLTRPETEPIERARRSARRAPVRSAPAARPSAYPSCPR